MKTNIYLKFTILICIFSLECFSSQTTNVFSDIKIQNINDINIVNTNRCVIYNSETAKITIGTEVKSKKIALRDFTKKIDTFLTDKKNVDSKRHATTDEQRVILQPLMATAIIYGETKNETYAHHGLIETDTLYRHFEILRAVEVLSFKYMQSIKDFNKANDDRLLDRQLEYNLLEKYGSITREMFDIWFAEELEKHKIGFSKVKLNLPSNQSLDEYVLHNGKNILQAVLNALSDDKPINKRRREKLERIIANKGNENKENIEVLNITTSNNMQSIKNKKKIRFNLKENETRDRYENLEEINLITMLTASKIKTNKPKKPHTGNTIGKNFEKNKAKGTKFTTPEMLKAFLVEKMENSSSKTLIEAGKILAELQECQSESLNREEYDAEVDTLCINTDKNGSLAESDIALLDKSLVSAFEGCKKAKEKKEFEYSKIKSLRANERIRLSQFDIDTNKKNNEETIRGIAWECKKCKINNPIDFSNCRICATEHRLSTITIRV